MTSGATLVGSRETRRPGDEVGPPDASTPAIEAVGVVDGRLAIITVAGRHLFHPLWLRDRSLEPGDVDPVNRQRLFEPGDTDLELRVQTADLSTDGFVTVDFSDGRNTRLSVGELLVAIGAAQHPDELPPPIPWDRSPDSMATLDWSAASDPTALLDALTHFHRYGWFVMTGTPTDSGSLLSIAATFGRVSATNFGTLFDVETHPDAVDLAYTPVALSAHLDQPYRRPTPGIQFLHTLANDAVGGESTVVDGLAAIDALRQADPEGYDLLARLPIEFRYDIGSDVVIDQAPIIDLHLDGTLRQFRFSTRLDFAPAIDPDVLDQFYAARRWLAGWLNDPAHHVQFKMAAGDVLVADNHRVLHGRTRFDPSTGHRHLQGCYVDHDGPASMWRLLRRQRANDPRKDGI